jgi:hypothetical protein
MTQGKCKTCKVRYTWQGAIARRRGVRCPCCGDTLWPTTHLLKNWPTRLTTRAGVHGRATMTPHCFGVKGCKMPMRPEEQVEIDRLDCNDTGFPREGTGLQRGL